jgi:8-oxo-dGTP pyrophosphatase MutT (NUDIX family)
MNEPVYMDWKSWGRAVNPLPGERAHLPFMPYGRTSAQEARSSGQVGVDFREAAVLLGVEADGRLALIERTPHEGVHGGQMALPGGGKEEGETLLDCALREWREELGLSSSWMPDARPIPLTEVHVAPSRFVVRPFLAPVTLPAVLSPDPVEVAGVYRMCLHELLDPLRQVEEKVQVGGREKWGSMSAPGWRLSGIPFVWGATAMMLGELASILAEWKEGADV